MLADLAACAGFEGKAMSDRKIVIRQKTLLLVCSMLAALWYVSFLWAGRPVKLVGAPKVAFYGISYDQFNYQLHQRTAFFEDVALASDVTLVVVLDWDQLDEIDGLRDLCGDACSDDSEQVLVRINKLRNLFSYQKFVFLRVGEISQHNYPSEGEFVIPDDVSACLFDGLVKEIQQVKFLNPYEGCLSEAFVQHGSKGTEEISWSSGWGYGIGF